MLKLARALSVLIGALVFLYLADLALLNWWTSDPMIVQLDAAPPADVPMDNTLSGDLSVAQDELLQARAYDGLSTWAVGTTGLVGLSILVWFGVVFARERRTFGPASQASAFPYWIMVIAGYLAVATGLFFWLISPMELVRYINDIDFYLLVALVGLFGALAFWLASLFGIAPKLRPSVPLGARFS